MITKCESVRIEASKCRDVLEIGNCIVPLINCVLEKAILVSGGLASYFVKSIRVNESCGFQPYGSGEFACTNAGQKGSPIPAPRKVLFGLIPAMCQ